MTVSYISLRSCAYFNAPIPFLRPSFDQLWLHSYRPQTTAPLAVAFDTMGKARTINPFPKGNESLFLNSGQLSCCQRLSSEQNKPPHQTMVLSLLSKIYYGSFKVVQFKCDLHVGYYNKYYKLYILSYIIYKCTRLDSSE